MILVVQDDDTTHTALEHCWVWCQSPGADTIPRRLEPLPNLYTFPLKMGLKKAQNM
jgi:hypothetical protein